MSLVLLGTVLLMQGAGLPPAAAGHGWHAAGAPQQTAPVPVRDDCQGCTLSIRQVFATTDSEGMLRGRPYSVLGTSTGGLIAGARALSLDLPVVFDSLGRYVRTLGRVGPGPGEISIPVWTAHLAGDTVRVFMAGRISDFTTDGRFVRARGQAGRSAFVDALLLFPSGTNVVLGGSADTVVGGDRYPVSVRDGHGTIRARFGIPGTRGEWPFRTLGLAREHERERFWVAQSGAFSPRGYQIVLVGADGTVHRWLAHNPAWWLHFPSVAVGRGAAPSGPVSYPTHVRERADGVLLVAIAQAKPTWRSIPARIGQYETKLVAIDLATASVRGTATVPGRAARFISDSRVVTYAEAADGEPQLTVHEVRLR